MGRYPCQFVSSSDMCGGVPCILHTPYTYIQAMPTPPKRKASVELKNVSDDNGGSSDEDNSGSSDEDNVGSSDEERGLAVLLATLSIEADDFELPDGWVAEQLETKQQQCADVKNG